MADEITISTALSFLKGSRQGALSDGTKTVTFTGTNFLHNAQNVGTTEEALLLGDTTTGGWLIIVNRDATNYVQLRFQTAGTAAIRLKAGDPPCAFRSDSASTITLQANTAPVEVEYLILED